MPCDCPNFINTDDDALCELFTFLYLKDKTLFRISEIVTLLALAFLKLIIHTNPSSLVCTPELKWEVFQFSLTFLSNLCCYINTLP